MPLLPVAVYGLEVPCGGMPIAAIPDFPATFRITMAAIDPNAEPQVDNDQKKIPPRATLKLIREPISGDDDESDDEDDSVEAIRARLGLIEEEEEDSEEESEDDDEKNGGPSDPTKSKKARKEAAMKEILEELKNADDMDVDEKPKKNKGKARATDDEDSEEEDSDDEEMEMEEFVICTLDPEKHYQQPLDITIGENEQVYFQVTGAYDISLTGNYVVPDHSHDDESDEDSEEEDYDLSPDEDELEEDYDSEEEDELDGLENPRITELGSDDEEPPKLVEASKDKKGKNKRSAAESESLDDMISKESEKLSKKQQKKLKNNEGKAVAAEAKDSPADKKKVQFAKNLEQGPTGSPLPKKEEKKEDKAGGLGVKVVNGVTIDDKKLGTGPAAKKGDRIGMRYIGKLQSGKVFDSNKKGKPFSFKLGSGEVIKGWDIGVAGMKVGGERRITIPSNLAYGKQNLPGIPANSVLVFDIKMVSIN